MSLVTFPVPRAFRDLERLADGLLASGNAAGPAYDIRQSGTDSFELTLAVPGFAEGDLKIAVEGRKLVVEGQPKAAAEGGWLRRGIVRRPFAQSFALAQHVEVRSAKLENGLLQLELARVVPEAEKPRQIAIGASQGNTAQAAA